MQIMSIRNKGELLSQFTANTTTLSYSHALCKWTSMLLMGSLCSYLETKFQNIINSNWAKRKK